MKSLEEYVELSKKIHGDITMIQPKSKKGSGFTTVVKPKRKLKKIEVLPDTYLETRDQLVEKQEAMLKKYEKIQELRKKGRNIPASSLIKEYQQILGKDYVPELNTDPGEVVASYIVRSGPGPSYHYYYRFKQSSSIPNEQYLPLMKEVSCMENKSGDLFTFRFHVYQQKDGTLKIQGVEKFSYDAVMSAFENVFKKTLNSKLKTDIKISKSDYDVVNALGMFDIDNAFLPYSIGDYTVESGNTNIEINRITREKISEKGGGVKPYTFKITSQILKKVKIPEAVVEKIPEPVVEGIPEPIVEKIPESDSQKLKDLYKKLDWFKKTPLKLVGEKSRDGKRIRLTDEKQYERDRQIKKVEKEISDQIAYENKRKENKEPINKEYLNNKIAELTKQKTELGKRYDRSNDSDRALLFENILKKDEEIDGYKKKLGGSLKTNDNIENLKDYSKNLLWFDSRVKRKYKII
jgi:hypothetical protein